MKKKIIEFGCGNLDYLNEDVKVCVDIDEDFLKKCRDQGYETVKCNLNWRTYPFDSNSVDKIYIFNTLEHIERKTCKVLEEFWRILKPQGELHLKVPNAYSWKNRLLFLFGHLPDTFRPQHKRFFSFRHMDMLMRNTGFITKKNRCNYIPQFILDLYKGEIEIIGEKQL